MNMNPPMLMNINSMPYPLPTSTFHSDTLSRSPFNLKLGSLNCRSIAKTASPMVRSSFIRHLRSLSFDLLAL